MIRRRRTQRKWIGIGIFLVFVVLSGAALVASGDMQNPLRMFMQSTPSGEMPERGEMPEGERPERPEGGGERGGGGESATVSLENIQWNRLGEVLYDLWLMCALTAVVMFVAPIVGLLLKPLRRRRGLRVRPQAG